MELNSPDNKWNSGVIAQKLNDGDTNNFLSPIPLLEGARAIEDEKHVSFLFQNWLICKEECKWQAFC